MYLGEDAVVSNVILNFSKIRDNSHAPLCGLQDKLTPSEGLGDLLRAAGDADASLACYQRANVPGKVIEGLAAKGDFAALSAFSAAQGYKPDYLYLLQRMCMDNPEAAVGLAKAVAKQPGPPIDLNTMADLFLQRNMVREATAYLLDVLQDNAPEHDKLQTKVCGVPSSFKPVWACALPSSSGLPVRCANSPSPATHTDRQCSVRLAYASLSTMVAPGLPTSGIFLHLQTVYGVLASFAWQLIQLVQTHKCMVSSSGVGALLQGMTVWWYLLRTSD